MKFILVLVVTAINCFNLSSLKSTLQMQKKKVILNQPTIIDVFVDYGATVSSVLVYHGFDFKDHPCQVIKSGVNFYQINSQSIIEKYSPAYFESLYREGQFQGEFPKLLSMVHIDDGVVILSNTGILFLYSIRGLQFKQQSQQQLPFNFKEDVKMFYSHKTVYIVSDKIYSIGVTNVNFDAAEPLSNFQTTQLEITNIQNIVVSSKYVYLARGLQGLSIMKAQQNDQFSVIEVLNKTAKCLRVVSEKNREILFILNDNGIMIYEYENKLTLIMEINIQSGNTLILLRNDALHYGDYFADDIHFNLTEKAWMLLNTWAFPNEIREVQVTEDFGIFLGIDGHYTIQHSVYSAYYNNQGTGHITNQIAIHGLVTLDFFANDLHSQEQQESSQHDGKLLFGITNHKLVSYIWREDPLKIFCLSDNYNHVYDSPLYMTFYFNTTQCPQKLNKEDDLVICQQTKSYEVRFVKWALSSQKKFLVFLLFFSIVILCITIFIVLIFKYYLYIKRQRQLSKQLSEIKQDGNYQIAQISPSTSELQSAKGNPYIKAELESRRV